jgi:hypothetical protein
MECVGWCIKERTTITKRSVTHASNTHTHTDEKKGDGMFVFLIHFSLPLLLPLIFSKMKHSKAHKNELIRFDICTFKSSTSSLLIHT